MARYKLIEPLIKTVEQGKQNAGTKYLVAKLQNTLCPWEDMQTFTCFIQPIVNILTPLLSIQHGGTAQADQPIPEELQYVTGLTGVHHRSSTNNICQTIRLNLQQQIDQQEKQSKLVRS